MSVVRYFSFYSGSFLLELRYQYIHSSFLFNFLFLHVPKCTRTCAHVFLSPKCMLDHVQNS
jgi:hypothetical protein